jgi:hypothetical protein
MIHHPSTHDIFCISYCSNRYEYCTQTFQNYSWVQQKSSSLLVLVLNIYPALVTLPQMVSWTACSCCDVASCRLHISKLEVTVGYEIRRFTLQFCLEKWPCCSGAISLLLRRGRPRQLVISWSNMFSFILQWMRSWFGLVVGAIRIDLGKVSFST